ncbi:hypothetical protein ACFO6R_16015 [Eubacterium multiforme]|uniref:Uncharacterized protein n=1 Tax=Eubacterium multiforme TaxID=83339 RepID=A0ABT9UTH5_9FIRM|nr:hypothetical protein [Eubacterium multiforme]MDQ0149632.1 hypothetical protein [Eubacterium multiforme]
MVRADKHYRMTKENLDYIEKIKNERHLKYPSEALETIIREHSENETLTIEERAKFFAKEIALEFSKELVGIKYASREADKNSKIILELLNGIYLKEDYGFICTTDTDETEGVKIAKKFIEGSIKNKRTKKLYKEY